MLTYWLVRGLAGIVGVLPQGLRYGLSNFIAWLLLRIVRYRVGVVRSNLAIAFPEKTVTERDRLLGGIYRNISDIMLETLAHFQTPMQKLMEIHEVDNPEVITHYTHGEKRSVILVGGHLGNWEMGVTSGEVLQTPTIIFYKPVANRRIDEFVRRGRTNSLLSVAPVKEAKQVFLNHLSPPHVFGLIADQSPRSVKSSIWVDFFSKDTAFFAGPERFAIEHDLPVVYYHNRRTARGRYRSTLTLITDSPRQLAQEGEITRKWVAALEASIRQCPEQWLWTHKRWKKKR